MKDLSKRAKYRLQALALLFAIAALGAGGFITFSSQPAVANPGNPNGYTNRALISDGQSVDRVVYFEAGVKTMANTTPVVSDSQCQLVGTNHRADVVLVGTMSGTAPTLTIKWQNSVDGVTWQDVGTWTEVNATSVPTLQSNVVSDLSSGIVIPFTTPATVVPKVYGDCWRASYTFGGTGTVTASFKIVGVDK